MNKKNSNPITILIADDDPEDCMLAKEALEEGRLINDIQFVENGEELMDYLLHKGKFSNKREFPSPGIILLDLNMPKMDGREALKEIKTNNTLRQIPLVILTTSKAEEDIIRTYNLGVNSYITKPITFEGLVNGMKVICKYWFEIVELPN